MSRPDISTARVYDDLDDGRVRLLVDGVWPRGISKDDLGHDEWIRDIAPSEDLRKWFAHDADKWDEFQKQYRAELDSNGDAVQRCLEWCHQAPVTLLFAAKDREHNQAVVLRDYLAERL